jgi:hypothetical protein
MHNQAWLAAFAVMRRNAGKLGAHVFDDRESLPV